MPFHQITSLSNASLNVYPNNSLTKFIHQLPLPIEFDQTQHHTIELKSISLDFKLENKEKSVSFIKIHLEELDPRLSSQDGDGQCLARIPFSIAVKPKKQEAEEEESEEEEEEEEDFFKLSDWWEAVHPIAIPLTHISRLDKLSYFITDENNQQLELKTGVSTVINVLICEMKYQDHFTITLNPSVSKDSFTRNVNNNFYTSFPSEINLGSGWEVALHSVIVPYGIHVEPKYAVTYSAGDTVETAEWLIADYSDADLFFELNSKIQEWGMVFYYDYDEDEQNERVFLRSASDDHPTQPCTLKMNDALYEFFGHKGDRGVFRFTGDWLDIGQTLQTKSSSQIHAENRVDHLVLYCDILADSIMGNRVCPLLDILSCDSIGLTKRHESTLYNAPNLTFRPVAKEIFSTIHVMIHTLDGSPAPISCQTQNISTTLYFRQNKSIINT